jgi:hemerythrin
VSIVWTTEYAVGVPLIDQQHQELFRRINALLQACNEGQGKEKVGEILNFLEEYVQVHFGSEEEVMIKHAYPEYLAHRKQHQHFVENFMDLKRKFEQEGAGIHLVVTTNKVVVDWLRNHILLTDTKLGAFLKERIK